MGGIDGWLSHHVGRLPHGRKLQTLQNRAASFVEQGLQGVANLAVNAILARNLTHEDFATIGLMLGVYYFMLGLHRAAISLPFILDMSQEEQHGGSRSEAAEARWWWFNLAAMPAFAAIVAVCAAVAWAVTRHDPNDQWFAHGILLATMITPALLLFEFGRRLLYQKKLPVTAAFCSAVYLVLNLSSAWLLGRATHSPDAGAFAWVIAGLGSSAMATLAARPGAPRIGEGFRLWWASRQFVFWQSLTNFPYAIYNSSVVIFVGIFGGAQAAAPFTATRTLTNPAISMVTAVDSLDKPRAARGLAGGGLAGLRWSVGRTRRLLAMLCGGYLGLLIVFAGPVLHFAFGNAYANQVNEIRMLVLAFFMMCMNQPSETLLIVLRESRLLLTTRILAAILAIGSLWIGARYGVMGVCVGLLATQVFNLVDLRIAEVIAERRWRRQQPSPPPPVPVVAAVEGAAV